MKSRPHTIFLADYDEDDQQFLIDAFTELPHAVTVTTFDNGVELMDTLLKLDDELPDMIFLDLFHALIGRRGMFGRHSRRA